MRSRLDRNTVERTFRRHLRALREGGSRVTPRQEADLRRLHERIAAKVERRGK